jgi:hypothetical protein
MAKRSSLRASDEEREQIIERLHAAATEGRIAAEELEHRVSAALKARTYGELDATVADLPAPRARGRRAPAERRSAAGWALSTVRHNPVLLVLAIPLLAVTATMLLAVTILWAILMVVVLTLGGRSRMGASPLIYARRHAVRQVRRRGGRHWA